MTIDNTPEYHKRTPYQHLVSKATDILQGESGFKTTFSPKHSMNGDLCLQIYQRFGSHTISTGSVRIPSEKDVIISDHDKIVHALETIVTRLEGKQHTGEITNKP